jgi:hypothetical protein
VVKRGKKGNGRRAFLALRAEIKRELDAGAFAKTVHARFEERLGIGYRQFAKYVKRYELLASDHPMTNSTGLPAGTVPRTARSSGTARAVHRSCWPILPPRLSVRSLLMMASSAASGLSLPGDCATGAVALSFRRGSLPP